MLDELDLLEDGETLDLNGADGFDDPTPEWTIDMNGPFSLLNYILYRISVVSDQDGTYDEIVTVPLMASEQAGSILWVLLTSGFFHRLRLEAIEPGEAYHLRFCEATMYYQGQLS